MNSHHARLDKSTTWKMFDQIAPSYDFLNRFLSLRRDVAWRRKMTSFFPMNEKLRWVDMGTGTGDMIIAGLDQLKPSRFLSVIGMDLSEEMLALGRRKMNVYAPDLLVEMRTGDILNIALSDASVDVVTIGFAIRNVPDVPRALREMTRVLAPGGRLIVLECSMPSSFLMRRLYSLYFRYVLPIVGGLISRNFKAYRYLNQSVEQFPSGSAFAALMRDAGLVAVGVYPQTFGVATIYVGEKQSVS